MDPHYWPSQSKSWIQIRFTVKSWELWEAHNGAMKAHLGASVGEKRSLEIE
jgi:hypothetical protein